MTLTLVALVAVVGLAVGFVVDGSGADEGGSDRGAGGPSTTPAPDRLSTTPADATTSTTPGPRTETQPVTIAFAGDMNFEGVLRNRLDAEPATAVGPFAPLLQSADLAIGNLETSIAVGGTRAPKQFAFRAPPPAIDALRLAGFDAVSMANNHGLDYGPDGLQETLAVARAQPDHFVVGIGGDDVEAFTPFRTEIKGQRIAVIGATQVLDSNLIEAWTATADQGGLASAKRVDRLVQEVRAARATSDTVIVFLHWGIEKMTCPSLDQQQLAQTLVDTGADVIVGGHAHRLQGAGMLGNALVGYGLGNFLFRANSVDGARTGVLRVTVTGRHVDSYEWTPGRISGSVPQPLTGPDAASELAYWQGLRGCTGLAP